jgi:outer membrane immunogenic protein
VFVGTGIEYSFDWLPGLFIESEGRAAWFERKDSRAACVTAGSDCNGPGSPSFIGLNIDSRKVVTYMARPNWSTASTGVAHRSQPGTDFLPT